MGKENKLNTRLKFLAIAVGLAWGGLAGAATLGNISILSGRGQPLQAEIELALADAAEADGLVVKVFAPEAYWNPGVALSASSLRDVSAHAEKRLNGSYVVKLSSSSPVDTEQLALLAEVDSSAGKAVREYIAQWPHSLAATAPAIKGDQAEAAGVLVKSGDNLNKIARANKPADVSMERMLVALYRANPQAFSGKNMNRLQAGKVLRMPGSDELAAVTQSAARRDIHVQVADWNAYRRKVSGSLAEPDTEASDRQSSGKIGNAVSARDVADTSSHQEVLKLSKGDAPGAEKSAAEVKSLKDKLHAMEEDLIARDQALQESKDRIAMLEKNNREMQRLLELKSAVAPAASAAAAEPTERAAPPVAQSAAAVAQPESAAAATEPASAVPAVAKSEPEVEVKPGANVAKYLWGGAALLLAGVGGWLFMRRGRKEKTATKKPGAAAAAAPVAAEPLPETSELLVNTAIAEEGAEALVDVTQEPLAEVVEEVEPTVTVADEEDEPPVQISAAAMSLEAAEDQAARSAADLESGFAALDQPASDASVALPEFVAESQEEPVFEAEPERGEGAPAIDIAAEIPTFLAQPAVSEEAAAATSEPEILLDGEIEEPVAPVTADESPAVAPEAVAEPSDAAVESAVHEAPAAPVAGAEVELDIPTIADFTPPETASVPPLPGMEGVDLNLIDDTNLTEEELHAKGEQWLQVATKLDLARAYQEMGDDAGAREILEEVMAEGDAEQKTTAEQLLQMLPSA
ncbi:FimV/HubP family polar landmark protein [Ferriphaselus sp. R-1]|uniref:FimV/HubP family polar landmark protein n=1 Tax=Ferriphaselus sp. R-1 TaxID=1485544 RepID=UPI0005521528|nr:FimV/HubP family polar landmark protein [Ferriphaselus sp. R-1]